MAIQEDSLKLLGFKSMDMVFDSTVTMIQNRAAGIDRPLRTRWGKLNGYWNGGVEKSTIYVIGGRPGVGKSAFVNKLLFDIFDCNPEQKVIILYFNFEMISEMQIMRELSAITSLKVSDLLSATLPVPESAIVNIKAMRTNLIRYPIYFMDKPVPVFRMQQIVEDVAAKHPEYHIVCVTDHTRLVKPAKEANELERLNALAETTMYLAKATGASFIHLSQLNRNIESPERGHGLYVPMLSDLFAADSIGQVAHVVGILQRPEMYQLTTYLNGENCENLLALHLVKNRNGAVLWLPFQHNLAINSITERI